jgi:hypothetical protein
VTRGGRQEAAEDGLSHGIDGLSAVAATAETGSELDASSTCTGRRLSWPPRKTTFTLAAQATAEDESCVAGTTVQATWWNGC